MNLSAIVAALIPDKVKVLANAIIDKAQALLQGEPALVIGNGAAVVIYLVAKVVGAIPDESFNVALAQAVAAEAVINGVLVTIRQFVYSPATVAAITAVAGPVDNTAVDGGNG